MRGNAARCCAWRGHASRHSRPPLDSGALPGLMRARLLADASTGAVERKVLRHQLQQAQAVYLCNAVRGLFQVRLI